MFDRVTTETNAEGRLIRVRAYNFWPVTVFLGVWVTGWTFGGMMAMREVYRLASGFQPAAAPVIVFLLIWLAGWLAGELFALAIVLWSFIGTEVITVAQGELVVCYDIKFFRYRKKYNVPEIHDITKEKQAVSFMYRGKKRLVGLMLNEPDAAMFMTYLRQCLPQGRFTGE